MKKITFFIVFIVLLIGSIQTKAQEINEAANWPNADWTVTGTYTTTGLLVNPTENANFSFDDDLAGSGSLLDFVAAESNTIDLTPATTVVPAEEQVVIEGSYVYVSNTDTLKLQWYDNDALQWIDWGFSFSNNSGTFDYTSCSGLVNYTSSPLLISTFSSSQLLNFKYRLVFDDNGHGFGFCFGSPTIISRETPLCFNVTNIQTDGDIIHNEAHIVWDDNNSVTPEDGWEIEYGLQGFSQGSGAGTVYTVFTNTTPFTFSGLDASTCYDVYIRAMCQTSSGTFSDWTGPFNFCTPIAPAGCGDTFYDIGGPEGNYMNSLDEETTFCPEEAGHVVTLLFDSFNTESGFDNLTIHDGDSSSAPVLIVLEGDISPDMISATLANGGCLTAVFHSDGSVVRSGWEARVLCSPPITCFMAEDLAVDEASIQRYEAELSWTDTNTSTPTSGWDVEYGIEGFEQGTGTVVNTMTNPFTLTGLTAATDYCFYVKANCGATSGDEDSFWNGPVCFTTKCEIMDAPYTENFDNGGDTPGCWAQGLSNNEDWLFDDDVTNPGHIGNGGSISGTTTLSNGYFAYVDDSSLHNLNTYLLSPFVDLDGVTDPSIGFYYISNDEFFNKYVNFSVDVWSNGTWTEDVFTHNASDGDTNGWEQVFISLAAFTNEVIQVRFEVDETNTGSRDDFAIDDVYIGELPICLNISAAEIENISDVDVTLSWVEENPTPSTAWQLVYGAPGMDPYTATPIVTATTNNPYVLENLTEQTDYEVYIRSDCGGGEYSLWAGPISFRTLCSPIDAPYYEDFEDGGVLDTCWDEYEGAESWLFANNVGFSGHIGNAGDVAGTTTDSGGYFAYIDDSAPNTLDNTILTPLINTNTLTSPTLSFYHISHNEGGNNVSFSVDIWDGAVWHVDFFTSNENTFGWELALVDMSTLTFTGPMQARFVVDEIGGDTNDDFAIDDVRIEEAPSCWPVIDPVVSSITTTSVDISFIDNNDTTPIGGWDVEITYPTFGQGTGTIQNFTTNPFTLTGLIPSSTYVLYIRANCAADDSDSSFWSIPITLTTTLGTPLNDTVGTAINLAVTADCQQAILGNNILSTETTTPVMPTGCSDPAIDGTTAGFDVDDVWYTFIMPASGTALVSIHFAGVMEDSAIAVYKDVIGVLEPAESYLPNGDINYAFPSCSDDDDFDSSSADDNNFSMVVVQNGTPGDLYYIRVWSVDRSNIPGETNLHGQFTICVRGEPTAARLTILDTNESQFESINVVLNYYPNPVTNKLNLNSNSVIKAVSIYNILGQELHNKNYQVSAFEKEVDMSILNSGTYFIKVLLDNDKVKTIKIIKK